MVIPVKLAPDKVQTRLTIQRRFASDAGAALLLGLITTAVFSPVLGHRFIESWDDRTAILANPDYNPPTWGKLVHVWIPPPKDTFFVPITYSLWGLLAMIARQSAPADLPFNAIYFYGANLAAHAAASVMVFLILRKLIRERWAAWFGAAIFALHPIQVEAVANAWTVYTPLSALFGFCAIWQYLSFSQKWSRHQRGWLVHYLIASVAFVLGMLTKPTAVAAFLIILAIEAFHHRRNLFGLLLPPLPWLFVGYVLIRLNQFANPGATVLVPEPWQQPFVWCDAIAFYLWKVFVPVGFAMDYGRTPNWVLEHPLVWFETAGMIGLMLLLWFLRKRTAWPLVALAVFIAGLLPTIGIVPFDFQKYSTAADRYAYMGMLGIAIAAAWAMESTKRKFAFVRWPMLIVMPAALAVLSIAQLRHWQDDWQLAAYTLRVEPRARAARLIFQYLVSDFGHTDPPGHPFPAPRRCTLSKNQLLEAADVFQKQRFYDLAQRLNELAKQKQE